jgi:hypothetical protein
MSAPTSSDRFAVHEVAPGTWSVQSKAVPGFKLGLKPADVLAAGADRPSAAQASGGPRPVGSSQE